MFRLSVAIAVLSLTAAVPASAEVGPAAPNADETPDASAFQTAGSARLAAPVAVRFDDHFAGTVAVEAQVGGKSSGTSDAAGAALHRYSLNVARRHFEEAGWDTAPGKGRELVIKTVAVVFNQGPTYQVHVTVDRVQDGRRLGQAQGTGMAQADRSRDRAKAAWAPGPWGSAAMRSAMDARPAEDAPIIQTATIRALDSALQQLSVVWAGEQAAEAARAQAQAQMDAARKQAAARRAR